MFPLRPVWLCLVLGLLLGGQIRGQTLYYNTSSATQAQNTLDTVATNGTGNTTLLAASGSLSRCTSVAVDALNGKLFFIDGQSNALWSVNLNGSGLALVKSGLTNYPTDLALDVLNEKIYFTTSSTIQTNNTVQSVNYTGTGAAVLFTATGPLGNGVSRCTALAVDVAKSKIFLADAGAQKLWSLSLAGGSLAALASTANSFPTGLALDTTNQQVYFTASSPVQANNLIQRVNYDGSGLTTRFTASGTLQRCTALDLDLAHAQMYLSDAGANALWRIPLGGGSANLVLSGLPATAKKVRWFGGPTFRPPPALTSIQISGTNMTFNATNGFVGGTYYVLTSTNVTTPLSQWVPILTNVLSGSGNFTLTATNTVSKTTPKRFYILSVH
jgi:hypothetical protein